MGRRSGRPNKQAQRKLLVRPSERELRHDEPASVRARTTDHSGARPRCPHHSGAAPEFISFRASITILKRWRGQIKLAPAPMTNCWAPGAWCACAKTWPPGAISLAGGEPSCAPSFLFGRLSAGVISSRTAATLARLSGGRQFGQEARAPRNRNVGLVSAGGEPPHQPGCDPSSSRACGAPVGRPRAGGQLLGPRGAQKSRPPRGRHFGGPVGGIGANNFAPASKWTLIVVHLAKAKRRTKRIELRTRTRTRTRTPTRPCPNSARTPDNEKCEDSLDAAGSSGNMYTLAHRPQPITRQPKSHKPMIYDFPRGDEFSAAPKLPAGRQD